MPDLTEPFISEELIRCNRCGYCMSTCPTYRANRDERYVARGRNELVRKVVEGEMELQDDFHDPLFQCLLCGACTDTCFGRVKTDELMVRAREAWHQQHGEPRVLQIIFDRLLPNPERLTRVMRLLSAGKRWGLSELAHRLGILRWINATLDGAQGLVATMPRLFLRDRLAALGFQRESRGEVPVWRRAPEEGSPRGAPSVLYFIGCGTNYQLPRQGEAAIKLLGRAGCEVRVVPNVCCGLPPYSYGDRAAARRLALQNLDLLEELSFDLVVTECGSCSGFLKKWPQLLAEDAGLARAQALAPRVRDFTELLADLRLPAPAGPAGLSVTYHDPCHLRRGQGIIEPPRKLLTDVGGFDLRELPEADWCCGGAGSYNLAHPELSLSVLERKLTRVAETGAEVVASACPSCVIQLSYGERRQGGARPVRHVAELLAERQGLELTD